MQENIGNNAMADTQAIIQMGFDVLKILTSRFRQEIGQQFDTLWDRSLSELKGFSHTLFHDVPPDPENLDVNIYIVKSRYEGTEGQKDGVMIIDAFAEFIGNLVRAARQVLGEGIVQEALKEVIKMLSMVDKYQQEMGLAEYFIKKIK